MNPSLFLTLVSVFVASILGIVLVDAILTHSRRRDLAPRPDPTPVPTPEATTAPDPEPRDPEPPDPEPPEGEPSSRA